MYAILATIQRGETFSWSLAPRQPGEQVRAVLRLGTQHKLAADAPEAAVAAVAEATVDGQPGWVFTLTAAQTAALTGASYVLDERIELAGSYVQITDGAVVFLTDAVTRSGS